MSLSLLSSKCSFESHQSSSILDLGNGQSLKQLAEETRKENVTMRKLTEKSTQDAAAVKVLTIITLIYLPTTVVLVSNTNPPLLASCLLTNP